MSAELRPWPQIKRLSKPRAATREFQKQVLDVITEYDRMTVRQLFYQLVTRGVIEKTDQMYDKVERATTWLRRAGELDYDKIVDGSRQRHRVAQWNGIPSALEALRSQYRRDRWVTQPVRVEVWTEKHALAGIIEPICDEYGVPFVAVRGTVSMSLTYESAMAMKRSGKPSKIFYVGDHDPTGREIDEVIQRHLSEHESDHEFKRIAALPSQIKRYKLLTRPPKRSDNRLAKFVKQFGSDQCVEADALRPDVLERLIRSSIEACISWDEWRRFDAIEKEEQEALTAFAESWEGGRQ